MSRPARSFDASDLAALVAALAEAGVGVGGLVALVVVPQVGVGLAAGGACWQVRADPAQVVREVTEAFQPRWVWWDARSCAGPLVASGVRIRTCWDLAAVHLVLFGGYRQDPGAVWAGARDLPEPPAPSRRHESTLLDFAENADLDSIGAPADPIRPDGQLDGHWTACNWARQRTEAEAIGLLAHAPAWATLALAVQARQEKALRALPDPRPAAGSLPLAIVTSYAESAAAVLAVELAHDGLPLDRQTAEEVIAGYVGPRPVDADDAAAIRGRRDGAVLEMFAAASRSCDLRNPTQVRDLLARAGFDFPDTRSWRLEPFKSTHPGVAALLDWRKAERIGTTYGYGWLDNHAADGRLRGGWGSADGGAGRMTAGAGLHNMPAALRVAVMAEPGHVLLRADLGQIEPRVLAAVSGDPVLTEATQADDLYAPVAEQLHADRPTAKVAVLAAMYGQTSGAAGEALARMERLYPQAIAYLRDAEHSGLVGEDIRTFGGRLIRLRHSRSDTDEPPPELANADVPPGPRSSLSFGHGRYARNAVIQGAAAEFFKVWAASVRVGLLPLGGLIVLCLHDELLVQVPIEQADASADVMLSALGSSAAMWSAGTGVRFVADLARVQRWSDAKG